MKIPLFKWSHREISLYPWTTPLWIASKWSFGNREKDLGHEKEDGCED